MDSNSSETDDLQKALSNFLRIHVSKEQTALVRKEFGVASDDQIDMRMFMGMTESLERPDEVIPDFSRDVCYLQSRTVRQTIVNKVPTLLRDFLCIDSNNGVKINQNSNFDRDYDEDFESAYEPYQMRSLALIASEGMRETLRKFIEANKNLLNKVRLTGDQSTLVMLRNIYHGNDVQFGHSELASLVTKGTIGALIFFEDPLANATDYSYEPDLDSLCQQALVQNLTVVNTPSTALMVMNSLRTALKEGRGEMIPSFFFSLQHPSVVKDRASATADLTIDYDNEMVTLKNALELAKKEKETLQKKLVLEMSTADANFKELASIVEGIMDGDARVAPRILRQLQEDRSSPLTVTEDVSHNAGELDHVGEEENEVDEESVVDDDCDTESVVYDFARPDSASVSSRPASRRWLSMSNLSGRRTPAVVPPTTVGRHENADDNSSVVSTTISIASIRRESARENLKKRFAEFMKKYGEKERNTGDLQRLTAEMQRSRPRRIRASKNGSQQSLESSVTWKSDSH
mmetsp:Transcript_2080/g.3165  ORF Transcript_2080/g.3165 Transcript_2080/m.3165 type:complete len:519 (-) Transcript_2080:82-1638(-)